MEKFDIENWIRKPQFDFFKTYEDPFFNITSTIEVTNLYNYCKKHNLSFSLACIYVAIKCINEIQEFKLRIFNDEIYLFNTVEIGSTILNDDNTFSFCYFKNKSSIFEFNTQGKEVIENHKKGNVFEPKEDLLAIIHCSTIPWISFTGIKNARKGDEAKHGIPKIIFGKVFEENNIKKIPFSVEAHHALLDGFHVALLFKKMQNFINKLSEI
ncbi:CatA-like O-acetyltransferase [Lutibacter maritimus]|uniref:Chloramphenicol O-acetyltransferase type A n=1 Tax=Lutibacter maritimus TaxID=593133 RepID=A0A1I6SA97_9FLAO|nr:CatA-like O-acetyltransferase [Lutibacter maritimus]SFS73895.1 chloramphenicol O-acetyltransferase type A [Lutibacter maritimus]